MNEAEQRALKAFQDHRIDAAVWPRKEDTIEIDLFYPRVAGNIKHIEIGLSDVRASDGIKIHYDFERDGYVVMQPYIIEKDMGSYIDASNYTWEEVGFFQSWALEHKGSKVDGDNTNA